MARMPSGYIAHLQAAERLGIPPRKLAQLAAKGTIIQYGSPLNAKWKLYREVDVENLSRCLPVRKKEANDDSAKRR